MASEEKIRSNRDYWAGWGKKTARIAEELVGDIKRAVGSDGELKCEFERFLKAVRETLNPSVGEEEAVEMLAQHILTLPIFREFFPHSDLSPQNPVWEAMQSVVEGLRREGIDVRELDKFHADAQGRIRDAESCDARQNIMHAIYDTFFQTAFPRTADRLGIVYTPIPIVDFILKSTQFALREHFHADMGGEDVQILDPFTGTGTFLVRLIQLGLIGKEKLPHKYANEIWGNEILLLPYYIAAANIAKAYHGITGEYKPFTGITLADTFRMVREDPQLCLE